MLTPQALARTSQSYRRGYLDGFFGEPNQAEIASDDYRDGTFRGGDYVAGYAAGANDASRGR